MSRQIFTALFFAACIVILATGASQAFGQELPQGTCNGQDSVQGEIFLTPQSAPAGSAVFVSGSFEMFPVLQGGIGAEEEITIPDPGLAQPLTSVIWMDGGSILAELITEVDESNTAHFSGNINIPAGATAGSHEVGFQPAIFTDPACLAFQVTQATQPAGTDAYVQTTVLPSTGFTLLVPELVLLALGYGVLTLYRRKSRLSKRVN